MNSDQCWSTPCFMRSWNAIGRCVNRARSIYQYSSMAPRLSGQNCKFPKFLLPLNLQKTLRYKENNSIYGCLSWKPRSPVRILICRTWPIDQKRPEWERQVVPLLKAQKYAYLFTNEWCVMSYVKELDKVFFRSTFTPPRTLEDQQCLLSTKFLTFTMRRDQEFDRTCHLRSWHGWETDCQTETAHGFGYSLGFLRSLW